MFNKISVCLSLSAIEVDDNSYNDIIINDIDNNKYLNNNSFSIHRLVEDEVSKAFSDASDISLNVEVSFSFIKEAKFKKLNISFKADTYTSIKIVFSDGSSLDLMGENGDYNKYNYSFDGIKDNRKVSKLICYGSYGSEEFMELTIK